MRRNQTLNRGLILLLGGSLAVGLASWTAPSIAQENEAQGSGDDANDPAFAQKFWDYLKKADFQEEWSRWPGHDEGFMEGRSPHGAFLKVYVNEQVTGNLENPPVKSIIVKENYNEQKELVAITPMYRVGKDYDPEHNDWYWAKYKPDGTLFEMKGMKLSGKVQGCINCHSSAKGKDYVFTNDSTN